jgi:hypothetical protein
MRTKEQDRDRKRREYQANREHIREQRRAYYCANLGKVRRWSATSMKRNAEKIAARKKVYRLTHLEQCAERDKRSRTRRMATNPALRREEFQRERVKLRSEIITAYGGCCKCCGDSHEEFLTIDHIGGRGCHDRFDVGMKLYRVLRRQGFPQDKFRLLCMNCNFSFGMRGYCPHQQKLEVVA